MQSRFMGLRYNNNETQKSRAKKARDEAIAKKAKEVKDAKKAKEAKEADIAKKAKRDKLIKSIRYELKKSGIVPDSDIILDLMLSKLHDTIPEYSNMYFNEVLYTLYTLLLDKSIPDDKKNKLIKILTGYEKIPLNINDAKEAIHIIVSQLFLFEIDPKTQKISGYLLDPESRLNHVVRYVTVEGDIIAIFSICPFINIQAGSIEYGDGGISFQTITDLIIGLHNAQKWLRNHNKNFYIIK